ncbi:hypothetical protein P2H44_03940 [Albimonas sp. CAU 1670]|uniref:hypothetical protein n=1 Tax=Albimonas sp. CAU 1670 TaxID=3032599 RepID=UPI0023DC26B1|nr:hypothetical protein [Albimonas sp. CAU 1670]MDF2231698.1 hypothetical protein [Albimonas sp. CAU 1670]
MREFDLIEDAAVFLLMNPGWKVWVKANSAEQDGQVSGDLIIDGAFDRDDLKRRGVI